MTKILLTTAAALAIGAAAITSAWGASINRAPISAPIPHISAPVPHVGAPMQFNRVNFSNPASVRQFVSQPQPTATSSGRYLPWMVQNMYGERGNSPNMAGRAVLGCGC